VIVAYIASLEEDEPSEKLRETIKGVKAASEKEEPYIFQLNAMMDN